MTFYLLHICFFLYKFFKSSVKLFTPTKKNLGGAKFEGPGQYASQSFMYNTLWHTDECGYECRR